MEVLQNISDAQLRIECLKRFKGSSVSMAVEACQLVADGYTTWEAADLMKKNRRTVEAALDRLRDQLGAYNRTHLIAILFRNNLIQ